MSLGTICTTFNCDIIEQLLGHQRMGWFWEVTDNVNALFFQWNSSEQLSSEVSMELYFNSNI